MAFKNKSTENNSSSNDRSANVAGYLNVGVMGKDGNVKRLNGGKGIILRKDHAVEQAIATFCEEHPDRIQDLVARLVLTYGKASDGTEEFDLGL